MVIDQHISKSGNEPQGFTECITYKWHLCMLGGWAETCSEQKAFLCSQDRTHRREKVIEYKGQNMEN